MILPVIFKKDTYKDMDSSDNILRDAFLIGLGVTAGNKVCNFMEDFTEALINELSVKFSSPPPLQPKITVTQS